MPEITTHLPQRKFDEDPDWPTPMSLRQLTELLGRLPEKLAIIVTIEAIKMVWHHYVIFMKSEIPKKPYTQYFFAINEFNKYFEEVQRADSKFSPGFDAYKSLQLREGATLIERRAGYANGARLCFLSAVRDFVTSNDKEELAQDLQRAINLCIHAEQSFTSPNRYQYTNSDAHTFITLWWKQCRSQLALADVLNADFEKSISPAADGFFVSQDQKQIVESPKIQKNNRPPQLSLFEKVRDTVYRLFRKPKK